jgi:hypothetical protein
VFDNLAKVRGELEGGRVVLNDFKLLLDAMQPDRFGAFDVCDTGHRWQPDYGAISAGAAKAVCEGALAARAAEPADWMRLLGKASIVYHTMQRRGVMHGYARVFPQYSLDTVSGRSKTKGFNIQGTDEHYEIRHVDPERDVLIHLDWISADIRAAQLCCGDAMMGEAFRTSDPYTVMAQGKLTRGDCKRMLLQALYALDVNHPALRFFKDLHRWVADRKTALMASGYTQSLLGRKFRLDGNAKDPDHELRRVFNAGLQGTVAHAMHGALWQIYERAPESIIAETHDSIVLAAPRRSVADILTVGADAMLHPFAGVMHDNPTFPLRVYIGMGWKKWRFFREMR